MAPTKWAKELPHAMAASLSSHVLKGREMRCRACPTPCAPRPDLSEPTACCPLPRPRWRHSGELARRAETIALRLKARRLLAALARWVGAGFPITDRLNRRVRKAICEACPMWSPRGNAGLGECLDPRCHCTKLKRWLPTETCPQGQWPEAGVLPAFRGLAGPLKRLILAVVFGPRKP